MSLDNGTGEVLRIDTLNNRYYILNDDELGWEFMQEVSIEDFEKKLNKLENVYTHTWNKYARAMYKAIRLYIDEIKKGNEDEKKISI